MAFEMFSKEKLAVKIPMLVIGSTYCFIYRVTQKKCLRLPKHQTIGFCSITSMYLDSESIFINSDFGTSTSQIRQKLLEIHPLKDTLVFKRGGF